MNWPKLLDEESEENGSTTDEIQELEAIEEDGENEYDPDEVAVKLALLAGKKPWILDIRASGDKVVLVLGPGAPDSEELPYEIDGVPIEIMQGKG